MLMLSSLSATTLMRALFRAWSRRKILLSPITAVVIRMLSIPAAAMTSASPSLAQHTPTAPASICFRAMTADLWVLAWGR
jgi:hypothetical protein